MSNSQDGLLLRRESIDVANVGASSGEVGSSRVVMMHMDPDGSNDGG